MSTASENIQKNAAEEFVRIRAMSELTNAAKMHRMAQVQRDGQKRLDEMSAAAHQAKASALDKARRVAFKGYDDASLTPDARATLASLRTDAGDRADSIEDPAEAARLLERCSMSGNEVQAAAIAERADAMSQFSMVGPEWMNVLNTYAVARPKAFAAIEEIHAARKTSNPVADAMEFLLVAPTEISHLGPSQLDSVADSDPSAPVQAGAR